MKEGLWPVVFRLWLAADMSLRQTCPAAAQRQTPGDRPVRARTSKEIILFSKVEYCVTLSCYLKVVCLV